MELDEEDMINSGAQPQAGPSTSIGDAEAPLSKKAIKRAAKQARMEEQKPEKRKLEKQRRRENAQALWEGHASGTLTPEQQAVFDTRQNAKMVRIRAKRRLAKGDSEEWKGGVVIDLDFDELMNDAEIKSMASQLGYVYSANRLAEIPFRTILHTSFSPESSPRLWEKMLKTKREVWNRCYWTEAGIDRLAEKFGESSTSGSTAPAGPGSQLELPETISPETHSLVYLSADAEEELETLAENEIYIIGGIVDKNRYKNLCQGKAEKYNIRTARLPIGTYLANLPTRKVLTVNQVFSILVEYVNRQSWAEAFHTVIPQRKYHDGKRKRGKNKDGETVEGAESGSDMDEDDDGGHEDREGVEDELEESTAAPSDWSRADGGQQDIDVNEEEMVNS